MGHDKKGKIESLQDLADMAGVSRATASRALSDSPLISAKTRERIQMLARQHGYTVNRRARDFRLRRTSVISVVFMLDVESRQHMSDPFFLSMLGAIADTLAEHDYDMLLAHAPIANVRELAGSRVMQQSDGVIFVGQGKQHAALNDLAVSHERMVVWGHPVADRKYVLVSGDSLAGGHAATHHLLSLGRRRIAFFGDTDNPENAARYQGYLSALKSHGVDADPALKVTVPFEMSRARDVVAEVAASGLSLDAVVCASDVIALAAMSSFQERGIRVPDDVAVVGYDDIGLAAYSSPPLTTIRQDIERAGRVLVETILALVNGETVADTFLKAELVVRRSSGAPNHHQVA